MENPDNEDPGPLGTVLILIVMAIICAVTLPPIYFGMVAITRDTWCPSWISSGRDYECRWHPIWETLGARR